MKRKMLDETMVMYHDGSNYHVFKQANDVADENMLIETVHTSIVPGDPVYPYFDLADTDCYLYIGNDDYFEKTNDIVNLFFQFIDEEIENFDIVFDYVQIDFLIDDIVAACHRNIVFGDMKTKNRFLRLLNTILDKWWDREAYEDSYDEKGIVAAILGNEKEAREYLYV